MLLRALWGRKSPVALPGGPLAPRGEIGLVEWLVENRHPSKVRLADLRGEPLALSHLVRLAKGRWRIERDYREVEDEPGLDHLEGHGWTGWHHHVTLVSMRYAFLVLERARAKTTSPPTLSQIQRQLPELLLRLGEWCPCCDSRLCYDAF